jgi:hypothetical protein
VNLATLLLKEGYENLYDVAVVISNDSDLALPIRGVKTELRKPVGLLDPHERPSTRLRQCASFYKPVRAGVLQASQFPETLSDQHGSFTQPPGW